jgi:biotin operon repressor
MSEPVRIKLCECGCGKPTNIARFTDKRRGVKAGERSRFLPGHSRRTGVNQIDNYRRAAEVHERRQRVLEMYRADASFLDIAAALGVSKAVVNQDVRWLREQGHDDLYRNVPVESYVDASVIAEIERAWNDEQLPVRQIGERYGWGRAQTQGVVMALRAKGVELSARQGEDLPVETQEKRRLKKDFKKRKAADTADALPDGRKSVLRILGAAKRPVSAVEVRRFLAICGQPLSRQAVRSRLELAERAGLVARAEPDQASRRWFERGGGRWFIPVGAEQSAASLTLADAERETELAKLIEDQQDELQRGDWVDSEKGHWADKSIDVPLTADGFTILDTLGDEDEALQELIGDPA